MRFSVVTISFNAENVIEDTLKSVLAQTFTDFDYILVDGASKDNTAEIIKKYIPLFQSRGIAVKFKSEPDNGISDAFNKGVSKADGEIVSIINAGDCLLPDALEIADREMDVDVLYGNILWNDKTQGIRYVRKSREDIRNLMFDMTIMHPATFVKKMVYEKVGLFDTSFRYAMDQEILVRMQQKGMKFKYVDKAFVEMEAGGTSDRDIRKVIAETDRIPAMYGQSKAKIRLYNIKKTWRTKLAHIYRKMVNRHC